MNDYIIDSRLITLNSKNAYSNNGDFLSDMNFTFTSLLIDNADIVQNSITIESVEIPHSFYNVSSSNKDYDIALTAYNSGTTSMELINYTITMTEGNYNANTFITEFKNKYSTLSSHTIQFKLNQQTGIFTLSPLRKSQTPIGTSYDPAITIKDTSTGLSMIGLNGEKTFSYNEDNPTSFDFPCNFLGAKKLNIYSEALAGNNVDSNALGVNTLISSISVNAPIFGLILYTSSSSGQSFLKNRFLSQIDISIKDEDGNLIDFNNVNWTITLRLQSYKKNKGNVMEKIAFDDELKKERRKTILKKTLENYPDTPIVKHIQLKENIEKENLDDLDDPIFNALLDEI